MQLAGASSSPHSARRLDTPTTTHLLPLNGSDGELQASVDSQPPAPGLDRGLDRNWTGSVLLLSAPARSPAPPRRLHVENGRDRAACTPWSSFPLTGTNPKCTVPAVSVPDVRYCARTPFGYARHPYLLQTSAPCCDSPQDPTSARSPMPCPHQDRRVQPRSIQPWLAT